MDNYFISPHQRRTIDWCPGQNTTCVLCTEMIGLPSNRRELPTTCKVVANRQRSNAKHLYYGSNTLCTFLDRLKVQIKLLVSLLFNRYMPLESKMLQMVIIVRPIILRRLHGVNDLGM